ncbi:MAG TPA: cation:proton antiporter, partial [Acidimicrobiia bacterium]|nr:cation:proton antiporter [Acidimicrobiia bacterium]
TIADHWIPVVPAMAALAAFGIADALGGSGFIAAFVGGVAFGRLTRKESDATLFTEQIGGVLNAATLIVFGAAVLGGLWHDIGAREVAYAVVSLTVVRMVPVAIAMIKSGARPPTIAFLGWFGPRGLASIVFGVVVVEAANVPHVNTLTIAITVTVALSVFAHGATAAPLSRRYAAWCDAAAAQGLAEMESVPVAHQRPRFTPFTR